MPMTSDVAIEAAFARETSQVFTALITANHSSFATPWLLANNDEAVVSKGRLFKPHPFKLTRPSETDARPEAQLTVANVDQFIGQMLEQITSPIDITIELVLAATPDICERRWPGFELRNVRWNTLFAEGRLTQRTFARENYPPRRMTPTYGFPWMLKRK